MKRVFTILAATALIAGCYKSDLTMTTHPGEGKVELEVTLPTPDSDSGDSSDPDVTTPTGYTVILNGEEVTVGEDGTVELSETLEPGTYTIYVYSNTDEMEVENNITETGDGTITLSKIVDAGMVESLTTDLYFGTQTITVLADAVVASEVVLSQVTRTIKFNLNLTEGDLDNIKGVTATLSGIAQKWECVADIPMGDAVTIEPTMTQGESIVKSTVANDYLTGSIKVLGVTGSEQILTLNFTFNDGSTQQIESDISNQLAGSNDTKSTPLTLTGDLNTPIAGSMEDATIDNWTQVSGGSITVD